MYISEKGRALQNRGCGDHETYIPYITARDFPSVSTCVTPIDWTTGRSVSCLSMGESRLWHTLRFDSEVDDIREQYPLELSETLALAAKFGFRHPNKGERKMTTDFLVDYFGDRQSEAISYKPKDTRYKDDGTLTYDGRYSLIEKTYWEERGVLYRFITDRQVDRDYASNVAVCAKFSDPSKVHNLSTCIRHMIINHILDVDLQSMHLNDRQLEELYGEEAYRYWEIFRSTENGKQFPPIAPPF